MTTNPAPGVAIKSSGVAEAAANYRKTRAEDRKVEAEDSGELSAGGFARMLASAQEPSTETADDTATGDAKDAALESLAQQSALSEDLDLQTLLPEGLVLQNLVTQTVLKEQEKSSVPDDAGALLGTVNARGDVTTAAWHAAAPSVGASATLPSASLPPATTIQGAAQRDVIAVVAQGVEQVGGEEAAPLSLEVVPQEKLQQPMAMKVGEQYDDSRVESFKGVGTEPVRGERSAEGRHQLEGQWTAVERQAQPTEAMQRVLGQMTQFLSATGMQSAGKPRRDVGSGGSSDATGWDGAAAVQSGSGTSRLTDYAVSQAAASQQAQNGDAQPSQNEANMAFWMNSRQQRADMVLNRDGQSVRVQVTLEGNSAHITFRSDEQATRSMLDASIAQLREMLAAQGVELAGVQVNTQAGNAEQNETSSSNGQAALGGRRVRLNVDDLMASGDVPARVQAAGSGRGLDVFA